MGTVSPPTPWHQGRQGPAFCRLQRVVLPPSCEVLSLERPQLRPLLQIPRSSRSPSPGAVRPAWHQRHGAADDLLRLEALRCTALVVSSAVGCPNSFPSVFLCVAALVKRTYVCGRLEAAGLLVTLVAHNHLLWRWGGELSPARALLCQRFGFLPSLGCRGSGLSQPRCFSSDCSLQGEGKRGASSGPGRGLEPKGSLEVGLLAQRNLCSSCCGAPSPRSWCSPLSALVLPALHLGSALQELGEDQAVLWAASELLTSHGRVGRRLLDSGDRRWGGLHWGLV